jgi:hypothetical protein
VRLQNMPSTKCLILFVNDHSTTTHEYVLNCSTEPKLSFRPYSMEPSCSQRQPPWPTKVSLDFQAAALSHNITHYFTVCNMPGDPVPSTLRGETKRGTHMILNRMHAWHQSAP